MTNSQILDAINQNIKQNGKEEITGVILNSVLRMLLDFVNQGFITFSDIIQLLADSKAVNVIGSINTTTETTSLPSGVYHAQTSGTYTNASNIVVKEGYYTLLRKDNGVWKLESEVKMPNVEIDGEVAIGQTTKAVNGEKVAEYIGNVAFSNFISPLSNHGYDLDAVVYYKDKLYKSLEPDNKSLPTDSTKWIEIKLGADITTESTIIENNTNPINSDAVLNFVDNDFWNRQIEENIKEVERTATNGYYNNQGLLIKDTNGVSFSVDLNGDYNKIKVSGVGIYAVGDKTLSSIFTLNSSGIKTELKPYTTTPEVMDSVEFEIPNDAVKLFYNAVRKGANPQVTVDPQLFLLSNKSLVRDSKSKTIDEILTPLYAIERESNEVDYTAQLTLKSWINYSGVVSNTANSWDFSTNKISAQVDDVFYCRGAVKTDGNLISFYDSNDIFISGVAGNSPLGVHVWNLQTIKTKAPANTAYVRFYTTNFANALIGGKNFLKLESFIEEVPNSEKLKEFIKQIAGENSGVKIGNSLIVGKPNTAIEIDFVTNEILPTAKPTIINGEVSIKIDDVLIKKYATLGVQGTSTAIYPKKNWSLALFNNEAKSSAFEMSIDSLPFHDEFVFKADWVDATNMRNLLCNRLWEQIIQSRKGFPKREFNEYIYNASDATFENRFPTRALGHVQGFPCIFKVNGEFYGVGCFNIGKKRQNYNLKKSNKKHIQLEDGSDGQRNLITWKANDWNVRNPSMTGYVEEGGIPDATVKASVDRLFAYHGSGQTNMIANFEQYYTKKNIFDKIIFSQAIYDLDGIAKNYILTTWDGLVWYHLPYDLDSVFGLNYNGLNYLPTTKDVFTHYESVGGEEQTAFLSGRNFYRAILSGYKSEINARYKELRDNGVLSVDNLYQLAMEIHLKWGDENFKKEFEKWTDRPSNTIIKTSISQILKYMEDRFIWLDTYFNYTP